MTEKERSFRKRVEKRRKEKAEKAKKEKNKYTIILRIIIGVLITFIVFSVIALIEAIVLICSDSLKHPYIRSTLCIYSRNASCIRYYSVLRISERPVS